MDSINRSNQSGQGIKRKHSQSTDPTSGSLPDDLVAAIKNVYEPAGINVTKTAKRESEKKGAEYGACRLGLNDHSVVFRVAKETPTKIGHFVTIWKKGKDNKNAPFDAKDNIDFVIINVSNDRHQGQFIFDQKTLLAQGIMESSSKKGKMAIRVYAPWTRPTAKQAITTQQWQTQYFFPIAADGTADVTKVRKLFGLGPMPAKLSVVPKPEIEAKIPDDDDLPIKEYLKRKKNNSVSSSSNRTSIPHPIFSAIPTSSSGLLGTVVSGRKRLIQLKNDKTEAEAINSTPHQALRKT